MRMYEQWQFHCTGHVTEQTGGGEEWYTITEWTHPCAPGVPQPHTRFALSAAREGRLSMPEIDEKERNYLFKSYTDLE